VDIISFTERLTHLFRELFLAKIFSQEVLADKGIDFRLLKDLLFLGNKEDFLLIYQALYKGLEAIRRSTYPQFQFELMIAKICEYEKFISIDTLLEKLPTEALMASELEKDRKVEPKLEPKLEPKAEPKVETKVELKAEPKEEAKEEKSKRLLADAWDETVTANKEAKEEKRGVRWEEFLDIAGKESATFRALLESVPKPEERDNKMVFPLEEDYPLLTSAYRDKLKDLVLKFFGKEVEFEVKKKRRDPEEVKNRPEVQAIMNILSAKIAYIQPAKGE